FLAKLSYLLNWSYMLAIVFVIILCLAVKDASFFTSKWNVSDDNKMRFWIPHIVYGLVILVIFIAIIFSPVDDILGPDDASRFTLHFFEITLHESFQTVQPRVKIM